MLVEGGEKYKVKLINPNGNREETIKEIVGALDHLNSISSEIFSTIRCRLDEQRKHVGSLTQRLATASDKVDSIKGSQKAIRIISPAKYPAELDGFQKESFMDISLKPLVCKKIPSLPRDKDLEKHWPFRFDPPIKHPDDLISCFHVRETQLNQLKGGEEIGLGRPPPGMTTVDSFLLFNTAENPYQHYRIVGKTQMGRLLSGQRPVRKGEEIQVETDKNKRTPAFQSEPKETDDFYYYPSTLQIPDIDVPEHLPDLPGIVDNLDFSTVDNMPTFFAFQQQRPSTLSMSSSFSSNTSSPFVPTPTPPAILSVTPTVLPAQVEKNLITTAFPEQNTRKQDISIKSTISSPPPPPPPPPPPEEQPLAKRASSPSKKPTVVTGSEDMRSNLMAAIREAGGAGLASLRSAKDMKYEAKRKKQEEKEKTINVESSDGGNLMADLKNSLAMRRKGISGIQTGRKQVSGVGDIMQKLVTSIPMDDPIDSATFDGDEEDSDNDDWD